MCWKNVGKIKITSTIMPSFLDNAFLEFWFHVMEMSLGAFACRTSHRVILFNGAS